MSSALTTVLSSPVLLLGLCFSSTLDLKGLGLQSHGLLSVTTSPVFFSRLVDEETAQRKYVLLDSTSLVSGSWVLALCCCVPSRPPSLASGGASWSDGIDYAVPMQSATQTGPLLRVKGGTSNSSAGTTGVHRDSP